MAYKRVRNGKYHYTVTNKLLPNYKEYFTFEDESDGDLYVQKLEAMLAAGKVPIEFAKKTGAIITIADAIDSYLDRNTIPDNDQSLLKVIKSRIGKLRVAKLNYEWAEQYVADMKLDNLAPSTIRHHVGALARCLDWLKRSGNAVFVVNPLRELPKRYATGHRDELERDRRLSAAEENEVRRILMNGTPANKERGFKFENPQEMLMLFEIAIETGMRLSEIFTLDKSQIDFESRTIFLDKTKNGDKRQVPMTSILHTELKAYVDQLPGEMLFQFTGTRKAISSRLSQTYGRVFEAAGCGDFTFHGLRHEATSRFYERTKLTDLKIAKILGWRSLKMALRYANLRGSDLSSELW